MSKIFSLALLFLVVLSISSLVLAGGSGSIWTTTNQCGEEQQNVNYYNVGEPIYINGENFNSGTYDWSVTGLGGSENSGASCDPAIEVADGSFDVDSSGEFCFEAYVVQGDDCGEYKVNFNNKKDNFHVDAQAVPEFGAVMGLMTLLASAGIFFIIKKN